MREVYHSRIITYEMNNLQDYPDSYLVVENGKILKISKERPEGNVIELQDFVILPGFVDTHTHLSQVDVRARWYPDLLGWLEKYIFPAEEKFKDEEYARCKAREFFYELKRNGTTTAAVYSSPFKEATDIAFKEAESSGLNVVMGQVMMDMTVPPELTTTLERAEKDIEVLAKKWHGKNGQLFYAVTPRFAVSCSMKLMKLLGETASKMDLYVQTHISEQIGEIEMVKKIHKAHNYATVYEKAELLGERTILSHGVHLSREELKLISSRNAKISHCPSSNFFLHSGIMDIWKIKNYGISVGFGSDIAAGPYFSMLQVARDASYANKISPEDAFYHLTLGGARVLNMDKITGSLETGKWADFVVLKVSDAKMPLRELLSELIYLGNENWIIATYVRGKRVYGIL